MCFLLFEQVNVIKDLESQFSAALNIESEPETTPENVRPKTARHSLNWDLGLELEPEECTSPISIPAYLH